MTASQDFVFRQPTARDGAAVFALMQPYKPKIGTNPLYTYLLLCDYFRASCVTVEKEGEIVAFTSAFIPPQKPDTLFVWEVAVKEGFHGHGLYMRMICHLLHRTGVRYMEGTVNPSNAQPERRLQALARALECPCESSMLFPADYFAPLSHEDEVLYRLGPFKPLAAA